MDDPHVECGYRKKVEEVYREVYKKNVEEAMEMNEKYVTWTAWHPEQIICSYTFYFKCIVNIQYL